MTKTSVLPINKYKSQIIDEVKRNQVVIIVGQTGCGKSTQVPQYLFEHRSDMKFKKYDMIACLHPRSVAVTSLAERVALERDTEIGELVGYRIRFYPVYSESTRIMFMTVGYLTRLLSLHRSLGRYKIVIIDEAHERSINNDIMMGQMKQFMETDKNLKLVIMSATLDVETLRAYYPGSAVVSITPTKSDVEVVHRCLTDKNYLKLIAEIVMEIIKVGDKGHILIFLPNELKVRQCYKSLKKANLKSAIVLKLYSAMNKSEKSKVFRPFIWQRKIICATNIAETSVTIADVTSVIDSGLVVRVKYDHRSRTENWTTERISWAEAEQRKGRTGRTGPGKCYRLYPETDIRPEVGLSASLKRLRYFEKESVAAQTEIIARIETEFTLQQLRHLCALSPLAVARCARPAISSADGLLQSLKSHFKTVDNPLQEFSDDVRQQLRQSLTKVEFFRSKSEADQTSLVEQLMARCSPAQIFFIIDGRRMPRTKKPVVMDDEHFYERLKDLFYEDGISDHVIVSGKFSRYPIPEIRLGNLGSMILGLKFIGQHDVTAFPFIVAPIIDDVTLAIGHLTELSLIGPDGSLTDLGAGVANLPLSPQLGKVALIGSESSARRDIFIILSMLSVRFIFESQESPHSQYRDPNGSIFKLRNTYRDAEENYFEETWCEDHGIIYSNLVYANLIVDQLERLLPLSTEIFVSSEEKLIYEIKGAFLTGFFHNLSFKDKSQKSENENKEMKTIETLKRVGTKKKNNEEKYDFTLVNGTICQVSQCEGIEKNCDIIMPLELKMTKDQKVSLRNCITFDPVMLKYFVSRSCGIPGDFRHAALSLLQRV